jgi:hypothetical protein
MSTKRDAMTDNTHDDEGGYLPVSRLAVAAAVVGVAAAAAVANPLFLVVPLIGVGLSVAALADVGREDAPKAGRLAAVTGLALSVGFALQSSVYQVVSLNGAKGRAVAVAEAFVVAVGEGRREDAVVMCRYDALPETLMPQSSGPLDGEAGKEVREKFAKMPSIAAVTSCGAVEPRVVQTRAEDRGGESWIVTLVIPCEQSGTGEVLLDITVRRDPFTGDTDRWLVTAHELL